MSMLTRPSNRVRELDDLIRRVERLEVQASGPAEHLPTLGALWALRQARDAAEQEASA
jgi:hypothetical protein